MKALALAALAVLLVPRSPEAAPRRTLAVAAAANVKLAMDELAKEFAAERPGVDVAVTSGASGTFFAQIQSGAPFDVFFSADRDYPKKLAEAGLAAEGEVVYAIGKLVVWAPRDSPAELERRGLAALADPRVKQIAIANPALAPYGRAALAALEAAGLLEVARPKLVLGQNVSQAAQFAQSGGADAAFIPLSLTFSPELSTGRILPVPPGSHPALEQSAVILRSAREPALARAFVAWVTGARGRAILARHGYALPA